MLACAPMRSLIHVPPITAVILCLGISWTGLHAQEKSWSEALNSSSDNSHYTPLKQITKDNVKELKVAWTYPTRDTIAYAFAPLVAGDKMYVLARSNSLVCLDATTGKEIWVHTKMVGIAPRGLTFWRSTDGKDRRLVFVIHNQLQELNAETGRSMPRKSRQSRPSSAVATVVPAADARCFAAGRVGATRLAVALP